MSSPKTPLVLVVDDEPVVRLIAAQCLIDAGFEVLEADSADSALEILRSRADVGILFTDVNMPGKLDGMDLARLVHEHWPSIQLVVTSGRGNDQPLPDDGRFVQKPYSLSEMTDVVTEVAARL